MDDRRQTADGRRQTADDGRQTTDGGRRTTAELKLESWNLELETTLLSDQPCKHITERRDVSNLGSPRTAIPFRLLVAHQPAHGLHLLPLAVVVEGHYECGNSAGQPHDKGEQEDE
jgi:hypothetical protein